MMHLDQANKNPSHALEVDAFIAVENKDLIFN